MSVSNVIEQANQSQSDADKQRKYSVHLEEGTFVQGQISFKSKYPPDRLAGLKRWKRGVTGNPNGRPRVKSVSECISDELQELDPEQGIPNNQVLGRMLVGKAKKGDLEATQMVLDRTEGKPKQAVQIDGQVNVDINYASIELLAFSILKNIKAGYTPEEAMDTLRILGAEEEHVVAAHQKLLDDGDLRPE